MVPEFGSLRYYCLSLRLHDQPDNSDNTHLKKDTRVVESQSAHVSRACHLRLCSEYETSLSCMRSVSKKIKWGIGYSHLTDTHKKINKN